ncbi:hypothetical protein AS593_07560 [Caulobacter vibrioides]|nr:hypothetical protein AS593_07560 [Caulobacter vibrioides]
MTTRLSFTASLSLAAWLAGGSAYAQQLGQGGGTDVPIWRVLGALLLCLTLVVGAALALKHRVKGGAPIFSDAKRRLQLVESVRLSHQVDVCLLKLDDREIVVAATPHGAVFLPSQAPAAPPEQGA